LIQAIAAESYIYTRRKKNIAITKEKVNSIVARLICVM
jgi:hypothetical protein